MKPLDKIKRVLYEIGLYDPDVNDKCVRIEIHTRSPHAFLNKSPWYTHVCHKRSDRHRRPYKIDERYFCCQSKI